MSVSETMEAKLTKAFEPVHMELFNESGMHAGPATESHFKLLLVSDAFHERNRVKRHQAVYRVLADELAGPVHALALHLYTPQEWNDNKGGLAASPECKGSK